MRASARQCSYKIKTRRKNIVKGFSLDGSVFCVKLCIGICLYAYIINLINAMKIDCKFVDKMVEFFKALGDQSRLKVIKILASDMEKRICVVDLAKKLGITQPAASQHLKILKNVGILSAKKEGYHVYYYINKHALKEWKKNGDKLFEAAFMETIIRKNRKCGAKNKQDAKNINKF